MSDIIQLEQLVMPHFFKRSDAVKFLEVMKSDDAYPEAVKAELKAKMSSFGNQKLDQYLQLFKPYMPSLYRDIDDII